MFNGIWKMFLVLLISVKNVDFVEIRNIQHIIRSLEIGKSVCENTPRPWHLQHIWLWIKSWIWLCKVFSWCAVKWWSKKKIRLIPWRKVYLFIFHDNIIYIWKWVFGNEFVEIGFRIYILMKEKYGWLFATL